jgi:hypothetical protein
MATQPSAIKSASEPKLYAETRSTACGLYTECPQGRNLEAQECVVGRTLSRSHWRSCGKGHGHLVTPSRTWTSRRSRELIAARIHTAEGEERQWSCSVLSPARGSRTTEIVAHQLPDRNFASLLRPRGFTSRPQAQPADYPGYQLFWLLHRLALLVDRV